MNEATDVNEKLRDLLTPAGDGRGFADAVLHEASGALARRRAAAEGSGSTWTWLERWARPWVLGALAALALLAVLPAIQPPRGNSAAEEASEVFLAAEQPEVALTVASER